MFYYIIFFVKIGIVNSKIYSLGIIVKNIFNGLTLITPENFLGAFWFIPMMLIAKILFVCVCDKTKNSNKLSFLAMILFGLIRVIMPVLIIKLLNYIKIKLQNKIPFFYV